MPTARQHSPPVHTFGPQHDPVTHPVLPFPPHWQAPPAQVNPAPHVPHASGPPMPLRAGPQESPEQSGGGSTHVPDGSSQVCTPEHEPQLPSQPSPPQLRPLQLGVQLGPESCGGGGPVSGRRGPVSGGGGPASGRTSRSRQPSSALHHWPGGHAPTGTA